MCYAGETCDTEGQSKTVCSFMETHFSATVLFLLSPETELCVDSVVLVFWQSHFSAGNREEAAALLRVAEELREIAAQLEHNVVARATQNLSRNISTSPSEVSLL